jgi:hypothetical protein
VNSDAAQHRLPKAVKAKWDKLPPETQAMFTEVHTKIPNVRAYCPGI